MHCVLVKSDEIEDWWIIERKEHDSKQWLAPMGDGGMQLMCSSRPCDADIEGTSAEMLAIAKAINKGQNASFKRCAAVRMVDIDGFHYRLCSPRNSRETARLTIEEAEELAADIIEKLKAAKAEANDE
jgi:hypothetical protein